MVKIVLRERESAQEAVRRLRKILDRSGLKRELRRRERYEKPRPSSVRPRIVRFAARRPSQELSLIRNWGPHPPYHTDRPIPTEDALGFRHRNGGPAAL